MKSRANWVAISDGISSIPWKDIRMSVDPGLELDRCVSDIVKISCTLSGHHCEVTR